MDVVVLTGKQNIAMFSNVQMIQVYIQWLQTQIIHRILPTNSLLYNMKLVHTNLYNFYFTQGEILNNLFY